MSQIISLSPPSASGGDTITSREIANITGKRHDHVMRDIRNLNKTYDDMGLSKVGESHYHNSQNKKQPQFILNKSQSLDLAMGYDITVRIRVRQLWEELEKKQSGFEINGSFLQQVTDQLLKLEQENKVLVEKANEWDRWMNSDGTICHTLLATELGVSCQQFHKILKAVGVMRKLQNCWFFTTKHNKPGFQKKIPIGGFKPNGDPWDALIVKLLPPGAMYIHKNWDKWVELYEQGKKA